MLRKSLLIILIVVLISSFMSIGACGNGEGENGKEENGEDEITEPGGGENGESEITEPGSRGTPLERVSAVRTHAITNKIPDELPCDTIYTLLVSSHVNYPCEEPPTFWEELYDSALSQGIARINQISCPKDKGCPIKDYWITHQFGSCEEGVSYVEIEFRVRCISEDEELTDGVGALESSKIKGPFNQLLGGGQKQPPRNPDEYIGIQPGRAEIEWPWVKECPGEATFIITLDEIVRDSDCQNVNYSPYLKKVGEEATKFWEALQCHCNKGDFSEVYADWYCLTEGPPNDRIIRVMVNAHYYFECLPK